MINTKNHLIVFQLKEIDPKMKDLLSLSHWTNDYNSSLCKE